MDLALSSDMDKRPPPPQSSTRDHMVFFFIGEEVKEVH